jgi:azurin
MAALRQYQWVETTAVSVRGEEKSRTQSTCYYGADGKLQKTPLGAPPQDEGRKPRGIRGKIVESKKEEMSEAAKEAVALVKQYVPPDPARIQAAKGGGSSR